MPKLASVFLFSLLALLASGPAHAKPKALRGAIVQFYAAVPLNSKFNSDSVLGESSGAEVPVKKTTFGGQFMLHYWRLMAGYDVSMADLAATGANSESVYKIFHHGPFATVMIPWFGGLTYTWYKAEDQMKINRSDPAYPDSSTFVESSLKGSGYGITYTQIFIPPTLIHLMWRSIEYDRGSTVGSGEKLSHNALMLGLSFGLGTGF